MDMRLKFYTQKSGSGGQKRLFCALLACFSLLVVSVSGRAQANEGASIPTPRPAPRVLLLTPGPADDGLPVPRLKPQRLRPVIVIDAGHGGHDPGAIGPSKTKEEDVTLQAALELRKQLLATGRYKVVLTRATDKYVVHDDRVLIARKAGADLFISLHADSTTTTATRGASVYTLASRAEKRSDKIVRHQKWVANVDLKTTSAPVGDILVDLAQRKTLSQSAEFANILIPKLKEQTKLLGNTHRTAGYYVLLAPDVPAVLLEMGFISNKKDEKLLKSARHRKKLMKAVRLAIDRYFAQVK